jgi:hypothetical protein
MFRTNVSAWPINTERLEIVLESQPEALGEREGLFFCTMPEFSGLLTTHHSPLTTHHSHHSHHSPLTPLTPLTTHTTHHSHHSPLTPLTPLTTHHSHHSPLTTHHSPLRTASALHLTDFPGLSDSIRFPGSIDNSRLHFESSLLEHCGPPFLRPTTVRQCAADAATADAAADSAANGAGISSSSWLDWSSLPSPLPPPPPSSSSALFLDRRSAAASSLFDRECACVPVEGFQQGYERESCGCQGGRTTSARVAFTVVYHTPG